MKIEQRLNKKIERPSKDLDLSIMPLVISQDLPFDLLKLADPSKIQLESYLQTGSCYLAQIDSRIVGVIILKSINSVVMEIKNIAVRESEQGRGYGKALLRYSEKISLESGYEKLIIGTGNSSIGQLALYQKEGFEIDKIDKNFFLKKYTEAIFENGIQCKHRILLEKNLKK